MLRFFSLDICKNSGRWKCPNENKCFNHDLVCDSKDDCKDGADETEKVCNEACPLKGELACIQNGNICLKGIPLIFDRCKYPSLTLFKDDVSYQTESFV